MVAYLRSKNYFFESAYITDQNIKSLDPSSAEDEEEEEIETVGTAAGQPRIRGTGSAEAYTPPDEDEGSDEAHSEQGRHDVNIAGIYLKEMNKVPLLNRQKEIQLAKEIQEGERKIRDLILHCPATAEEIERLHRTYRRGKLENRSTEEIVHRATRKLLEVAHSGKENGHLAMELVRKLTSAEASLKAAKAEMIQSNLRLVVSIAKIYVNRGLSFLDLIQEGNIGLMKAVTRYDYKKGFKFSTYASWWIRQSITRALADKSRTIRIPNHLLETRSKTIKAFHHLVKDLNREPFPEEIAKKAEVPLSNVLKVMSLIQEPVSLETPVGDDGSTLQDLVGGEESLSFNDDLIETMDLERRTQDLLSLLGPREEQILRLRFGIGLPSGYTLEEIGRRFGISRERVRQIEERALKKLKYPTHPKPEKAEIA